VSSPRPDVPSVVDIAGAADPVAAVLRAHDRGHLIALRTSGTTSHPRRVVRTTASWVKSFAHVSRLAEVDATSRVWIPGPLTATANLFAAVHARYVGAAVVGSPDRATHAHLTPATLLAALSAGNDLRGRSVVVAGDRLPAALARRAAAAGGRVSSYYGAAELSFVAWGPHEDDLHPFPGVEVDVRHGCIWVRSPYLGLGYDGLGYDGLGYDGVDGPFRRAGDGFATVGDRGSVRGDVLTVQGRGTEAVVTGGVTVQVSDVEQVLRRATGEDVLVVGVPHPRLGALLAAVLPHPAALGAARAAARAELSPAHRPRRWFHSQELPLTVAGKIDRRALAALAASGALATATAGTPSQSSGSPR
jgi:long-chain acyl-CoA synthetase